MTNLRTLIHLLSDGHFHSGQVLGDQLNITRSAIWKEIKQLTKLGIEVESIQGKGYRIPGGIEPLAADQIKAFIPATAQTHLSALEIFDTIDSTNQYLMNKIKQSRDLHCGHVCLAEYQTAGRGRNGRTWVSPWGKNIYLSMLWRFDDGAHALAGLTLAVGVAIARALTYYGVKGIGLKWPNDVYYAQQKLAGVLIEMFIDSVGVCHAVIGIGVNLEMSSQSGATINQPWTDVKTIIQAQPARNQLTALILTELLHMLPSYSQQGFQAYYQAWQDLDILQGCFIDVTTPTASFSGIAAGIDEMGALQLHRGDVIQKFYAGEVTLARTQRIESKA